MPMDNLKMNRYDTHDYEPTGVHIESFPLIDLADSNLNIDELSQSPRTRILPKLKANNRPLQRTSLPLLQPTPALHLRPETSYRFYREYESPVSAKRSWNSRSLLEEERKQPRTVKEVYKISFPCFSRCAVCAFTHCLGPVKVYVSQYTKPKPVYNDDIRDHQGRRVIPRDRRREFRGLVYDKDSNSCYPPIPKGYTSIYLNTSKKQHVIY